MFNPIYEFANIDASVSFFVLTWLSLCLVYFIYRSSIMGYQYVNDKRLRGYAGIRYRDWDDVILDILFSVGVLCIGALLFAAVMGIANFIWLPLVIGAGVFGILFTLRGVVRLRKKLDNHTQDKEAHQ